MTKNIMSDYTVVGLVDADGLLIVAGVLRGHVDAVDFRNRSAGMDRCAIHVRAVDPGEAEGAARATLPPPAGDRPVVRVDVGRLRAWLSSPAVAEELGIDDWAATAEETAELVQALSDGGSETGWELSPLLTATLASELRDGYVVFGADTRDGGRIATVPQGDRELRSTVQGIDAAVENVEYVAMLLDRAYGRR